MSNALSSEPKRLVIFTEQDKEALAKLTELIETLKKEEGYIDPSERKSLVNRIDSLRRDISQYTSNIERFETNLRTENRAQEDERSIHFRQQIATFKDRVIEVEAEISACKAKLQQANACQKLIDDLEMESAPYAMLEEIQRNSLDKGDFGVMLRVAQVLQGRVPEITKELATPFLKSIIGSLAQVLNGLDEELDRMASFRAKGFGRMFRELKTHGFNEDQAMAIILASIKPTTFVEQLSGIKSTAKK